MSLVGWRRQEGAERDTTIAQLFFNATCVAAMPCKKQQNTNTHTHTHNTLSDMTNRHALILHIYYPIIT